jgi:hypothetical protein
MRGQVCIHVPASGCFLSNHPVSHKARTLKPIAEARTIEARVSHMIPSSTLIQWKTHGTEIGSKKKYFSWNFLENAAPFRRMLGRVSRVFFGPSATNTKYCS